MIGTPVLVALAALLAASSPPPASLPVCGNRTIREVVKRTGCTLGDRRCWVSSGGYCTDHVERMIRALEPSSPVELTSVSPEAVRKGDVAVFLGRSHYAWVERVVRDRAGRPVSVTVSELNYGTCWVDADLMVTDRYGIVARGRAVPLRDVDGGFLRPRAVAR